MKEETKCEHCNGKGTYSQLHGLHGAEDFGGDGFDTKPTIHHHTCSTCNGTGKKLLVSPSDKKWRNKLKDYIYMYPKNVQNARKLYKILEEGLESELTSATIKAKEEILNEMVGLLPPTCVMDERYLTTKIFIKDYAKSQGINLEEPSK